MQERASHRRDLDRQKNVGGSRRDQTWQVRHERTSDEKGSSRGARGFRKNVVKDNSRKRIEAEIKELEARVLLECAPYGQADEKPAVAVETPVTLFKDLPLSRYTLRGLKAAGFEQLTLIQRRVIPRALAGTDLLGEAPTGSGKTLAFVVPLLEVLYRRQWDRSLGLGALVISPTRELATQIFEVIRTVGKFHDFSAACVIGGKDLKFEAARLNHMNIVVGTPGRLLQHLDESPIFDTSALQLLVVDEADQMVDMGFSETLQNILSQLPSSDTRHTWLFSATLTFANPVQIVVRDTESSSAGKLSSPPSEQRLTPHRLNEMYIVVELDHQLNTLFSFLRAHSQKKVIVFVNACKQVRFIYETFRRLKPGPAVFELHGRQNQLRRLETVKAFSEKPRSACLICTDVAARGLDFDAIEWVVQLNCPMDVETYIHRVGRTARYKSNGNSVLCLRSDEKTFLQRLKEKGVTPTLLALNPKKTIDITAKLASLLAANPEIKHLADRALVAYFRSVVLAPDKTVFNAATLREAMESYALSWGLVSCPKEVFSIVLEDVTKGTRSGRSKLERLKEKIRQKKELKNQADRGEPTKPLSKQERRAQRLKELREKRAEPSLCASVESEDENGDVLVPVRSEDTCAEEPQAQRGRVDDQKLRERVRRQQIRIRADGTAKIKGFARLNTPGRHVFFEDDSTVTDHLTHAIADLVDRSSEAAETRCVVSREKYAERVQELRDKLKEADQQDKLRDRDRVHERHMRRREKGRRERQASALGGDPTVELMRTAELSTADERASHVSSGSDFTGDDSDPSSAILPPSSISKRHTTPQEEGGTMKKRQKLSVQELEEQVLSFLNA